MNPECTQYVRGGFSALSYWKAQHAVCANAGAEFDPPRGDQMCAVSDSVFKTGDPLEGVRYRDPSHMSGWYINTQDFRGSIREMRIEHLYHLTSVRPELAKFLALPPGYRFWLAAPREEVWFDQKIADGR
jgi:hypothetical protein